MGALFVMVSVEDATVESLSTGLQSEVTTSILEAAVRNALHVPEEKQVIVEPFRNGIVLSVATAQTVENALEGQLAPAVADGLDPLADDATEDEKWALEALAYVRAGLEVIQGHGG